MPKRKKNKQAKVESESDSDESSSSSDEDIPSTDEESSSSDVTTSDEDTKKKTTSKKVAKPTPKKQKSAPTKKNPTPTKGKKEEKSADRTNNDISLQANDLESFILWNNKGGVGKSTMTFHLSTTYAHLHPDEEVIVIDLCPQANASMMLLGGGIKGQDIVDKKLEDNDNTIFKYLLKVSNHLNAETKDAVDLKTYLVNVSKHNPYAPDNIKLLVGDQRINDLAYSLYSIANQQGISWSQQTRFSNTHQCLSNSLKMYKSNTEKRIRVFIDTNPSFTIYTAMGVCAANRLIIPIKSDDSSRIGLKCALNQIYGPSTLQISFALQARAYKIPLPKIQLIIGNQISRYAYTSVKAYKEMSNQVMDCLYAIWKDTENEYQNQSIFRDLKTQVSSKDVFNSLYAYEVKDLTTTGIVSTHNGMPLFAMRKLTKGNIGSDGVVTLTPKTIEECYETIKKIVNEYLFREYVPDL